MGFSSSVLKLSSITLQFPYYCFLHGLFDHHLDDNDYFRFSEIENVSFVISFKILKYSIN
jgi:hypothetical protein